MSLWLLRLLFPRVWRAINMIYALALLLQDDLAHTAEGDEFPYALAEANNIVEEIEVIL